MKYKVGDIVKLNSPKALWHGKRGIVTKVNPDAKFPKAYPYCVVVNGFPFWFPESELIGDDYGT